MIAAGGGLIKRCDIKKNKYIMLHLYAIYKGDNPIISITLVKTPLDMVAKAFSSAITFGKFSKVSKKYYDDIYHVSMWINGRFNLEKLSVISLSENNPILANSLTLDIQLNNSSLTFNKL